VDRVAGAEGLRTILGVPLRVREEVIGTLMVAQREVRSFSENERSLMSSFAALASVAIDNARLLEDHRRAADDLSAVNQQLGVHVESVNTAVNRSGPAPALVGH
jgi:GAF domain-containing protein